MALLVTSHTQGLSNPAQLHEALLQAWGAPGAWSVCLCLQRHFRIQAPSATMNLKRGQEQVLQP